MLSVIWLLLIESKFNVSEENGYTLPQVVFTISKAAENLYVHACVDYGSIEVRFHMLPFLDFLGGVE